jgi:hypothetical protein
MNEMERQLLEALRGLISAIEGSNDGFICYLSPDEEAIAEAKKAVALAEHAMSLRLTVKC